MAYCFYIENMTRQLLSRLNRFNILPQTNSQMDQAPNPFPTSPRLPPTLQPPPPFPHKALKLQVLPWPVQDVCVCVCGGGGGVGARARLEAL